MTALEFAYIKRAVEAIESQTLTEEDQGKVLQTVSEITARAAKEIKLMQSIEEILLG